MTTSCYVLTGRNLATQTEESVGFVYGVYRTFEAAVNAMKMDIDVSVKAGAWAADEVSECYDYNSKTGEALAADEYRWDITPSLIFDGE